MTEFVHELLCVDASGNVSVVHLSIEDDDPSLTSQEADAVYTLDGVILTTTPVVTVGQLEITLTDGQSRAPVTMSFTYNGNSYYMLADSVPADSIAASGVYTNFAEVGGIHYTGYGAIEAAIPRPYQGLAFLRSASGANPVQDDGVGTFTVYDDDNKIQLTAETGDLAQGHAGYHGQQGAFANTAGVPAEGLGPTSVQLVEVAYTGGAGAGTFEALEFTFSRFGTNYFSYIPRTGAVDLADVTAITTVTVLAGSPDGLKYSDFGLNFATTTTDGTTAAELLSGSWLHDRLNGKAGDDTLAGSSGEDKLYGENGADALFGGLHADTLDGGSGDDTLSGGYSDDNLIAGDGADDLFGGLGADTLDGGKKNDSLQGNDDDDSLTGGAGADTLVGGAGNDTLDGGDGKDDLRGGAGDDLLTDGSGVDTLTGNGAADTFVFGNDGSTDTVADYDDGTDLIDLAATFGSLTFTDVAPGEVHVTHAGETLILLDTSGTLTSADLTNADFI